MLSTVKMKILLIIDHAKNHLKPKQIKKNINRPVYCNNLQNPFTRLDSIKHFMYYFTRSYRHNA